MADVSLGLNERHRENMFQLWCFSLSWRQPQLFSDWAPIFSWTFRRCGASIWLIGRERCRERPCEESDHHTYSYPHLLHRKLWWAHKRIPFLALTLRMGRLQRPWFSCIVWAASWLACTYRIWLFRFLGCNRTRYHWMPLPILFWF